MSKSTFYFVVFSSLFFAVAAWFSINHHSDHESQQIKIVQIRNLQNETHDLVRNTLLAETGSIKHFDYLASSEQNIHAMIIQDEITGRDYDEFLLAISQIMETSSQIRSISAVYHNSLLFFPKGLSFFRHDWAASAPSQFLIELDVLERNVMQFNSVASNKQSLENISSQIESLRLNTSTLPEKMAEEVSRLMQHAQTLVNSSYQLRLLHSQLLSNQLSISAQHLIDFYNTSIQHTIQQENKLVERFYLIFLIIIMLAVRFWWKHQQKMVAELHIQSEQLKFMAHYDELTQLPNRTLFADRFKQAVAHSKRTDTMIAICFLDLDNFKQVNDNYGHDVGDELLNEVANRIKMILREEDTISRQGGDEFAILLRDIESYQQCEITLARINQSIAEPYLIDDALHHISASIGYTLYPLDDADLDTLLRHADQGMYQAKLAGRNQQILYNATSDKLAIDNQVRHQEIKQALSHQELHLYYQPKVNMKTGEVFGVEALIRWIHPVKGVIPPLDFLPLIEGTELEIQIGDWVINEALSQMDRWQQQDIKLKVSINISSHHLQSPIFFNQLNEALERHPEVKSQCLQLEILESTALGDLEAISGIIKSCQNILGVDFALDDFGTGYSSLTHMKNLSANTIKIDQTFVRDLLDDPDDYSIIEGIIGLAKAFHRDVIAEGVETNGHGIMLLIMGCDEAQGYGISRPLSADAIPSWLANYTPNKFWMDYASRHLSEQEQKLTLLKLTTEHWFNNFRNDILSMEERGSDRHFLKCHLGEWLPRLEQEKTFDKSWLDEVKLAHGKLFTLANNLVSKQEAGDVNAVRHGLTELNTRYDEVLFILEEYTHDSGSQKA